MASDGTDSRLGGRQRLHPLPADNVNLDLLWPTNHVAMLFVIYANGGTLWFHFGFAVAMLRPLKAPIASLRSPTPLSTTIIRACA